MKLDNASLVKHPSSFPRAYLIVTIEGNSHRFVAPIVPPPLDITSTANVIPASLWHFVDYQGSGSWAETAAPVEECALPHSLDFVEYELVEPVRPPSHVEYPRPEPPAA